MGWNGDGIPLALAGIRSDEASDRDEPCKLQRVVRDL